MQLDEDLRDSMENYWKITWRYVLMRKKLLQTECLPTVTNWTNDALPSVLILAVVDEPNDKLVQLAKPLSIANEEI